MTDSIDEVSTPVLTQDQAHTVTLPSGNTVTFKDSSELRIRDRKAIMKSSDGIDGEMAKALAFGDAIIIRLIKAWSFPLPLPDGVNDSIDDLTTGDYDALVEATDDAQKALFPSLAQTIDNKLNPKATGGN